MRTDNDVISSTKAANELLESSCSMHLLNHKRQAIGGWTRKQPQERLGELVVIPKRSIPAAGEALPQAGPWTSRSSRMARALCVLSAKLTSSESLGLWSRQAM